MEHEQSYKTQVQAILEEIRSANLTLGNFKKYHEKVGGTEQIIKAQIENNKTDYQELTGQLNEMTSKQSFKDQYDGGIVSVEAFDMMKRMNHLVQATYGWKAIQLELKNELVTKMIDVLGETKSLDIERDALNRFNEMTKNEHDFFKNIMEGRFNLMEEKFNLFMGVVTDKMNAERRIMLKTLMTFAPDAASKMPPEITKDDIPREKIAPPEAFNEPERENPQEDNWEKMKQVKQQQQPEDPMFADDDDDGGM